MTFANPIALMALAIVPAIAAFQALRVRHQSKHAIRFTNVAVLEASVEATTPWARRISAASFLVALALLALGMAQPRRVIALPKDKAAVILAMDTSGSMIAPDIPPSRGKAAQDAAVVFIKLVPSTVQIATVRFSNQVQVSSGMSTDRSDARDGVMGWFPTGGSALGDALVESLKLDPYRHVSAEDRAAEPPTIIVVLSDGSNNFSTVHPFEAARRAKAQGVPIFAVTIGPREGVVAETAMGIDPPEHDVMKKIAELSGGKYYSAPTSRALNDIYSTIATTFFSSEKKQDITFVFVAAALALLLAGGGLSVYRAGRFP